MGELEFYDMTWENYEDLRFDKQAKIEQTKRLFGTQLYEGQDGAEYCFLPTKRMQNLMRQIECFYDQIETVDSKIELCNEVYYTTKIEGANTTFKRTQEIHDGKPIDHSNYFSEMMVKGGFEATKFLNVHGNKVDIKILRQMWELLVDGCCDNEDIKGTLFRTGEVGVGKHMGLRSILLEDAMKCWVDYYNSEILDEYPWLKAALLHVSYEMIHPFCDGNGRSGRLLMINYLISRGYDKCKAISFSKDIAESVQQYYAALEMSDNAYFDCTALIEFLLRSFRASLGSIVHTSTSELHAF